MLYPHWWRKAECTGESVFRIVPLATSNPMTKTKPLSKGSCLVCDSPASHGLTNRNCTDGAPAQPRISSSVGIAERAWIP
jgi:hypothetical protein